MRKQFSFFVLISFILLSSGCKKNATEPVETLALTVKDVSCTEAWVKITTTNYQTPNTLILFVNDKANQNITLISSDTLLYVDSLLPNQSYKIKAAFATNNRQQTTNEVVATTMDTTSHNFTWQTFTFGEHSSSTLYDVAIIDENNIWAVGEIYMKDSLGNPDPNAYNAMHWDGSTWEVKRITVLYRGNYITPQLYGIFALSEKEIWLSSGVPIKGDGNNWTQYHLFDMGVLTQQDGYLTKIWGSSSNDIYYVGTLGTIAHYDGKNWQKIESGTTLKIHDIWGDYNEKTKNWEILCLASDALDGSIKSKKLLSLTNVSATAVEDSGLSWNLMSIWFKAGRKYYLAGKDLYSTVNLAKLWQQDTSIPFYKLSITGEEVNDIMVCGGYGMLSHYNGLTWKHYKDNGIPSIIGNFNKVIMRQNVAIAIGIDNRKAVIAIGER